MPSPRFAAPLHVGRPNVGDRQEFHRLIDEILDRNWLTNAGPVVHEFERTLQDYLGVRNCIATCNGTVALEIAIQALDLAGDVILPAYTFAATAHAVRRVGATPIFADISAQSHNVDPAAVQARLSDRTSAILAVHLWGRPAPIEPLVTIANTVGIPLLFDAAHAFGCSAGGRMVGGFGRLEVLSFHATKFFNTLEGGAIVTNDDDLADRLRLYRNFGFSGYDNVVALGTNAKMNEVSAAMGLVNFANLDRVVSANRANHEAYARAFREADSVRLLDYDSSERCNYQYAVIEIGDDFPASRDEVIQRLHDNNVLARRYFWPGCHRMQPYLADLESQLPHLARTEDVAARVVVLPTGTAVSPEDCAAVAELVLESAS